jgi:hypothetical protein
MSQQDVHEIICPHRDRELERLRDERPRIEGIVLALRRKLIAADSTLPHELDGTAWMPIEDEWRS